MSGRDPEKSRRWREANREKLLAYKRQDYQNGRRYGHKRRRNQAVAKLWQEQGGRCYLCGEALESPEAANLDHDHRCCPLHSFCAFCVRGLSHESCNLAIGHAADDPDRLETIARNLRAKLAEMEGRLAGKPQQMELGEEAS